MKKFTSLLVLLLSAANYSNILHAQANTSLSNLVAPTAINQSMLPNASGTRDLGSGASSWRYVYLGSGLYLNSALTVHASGSLNYFAGGAAGNTAVTGMENVAGGVFALNKLTNGSTNSAHGYSALYNNTTGYRNTASGGYALYSNINGIGNTVSGAYSLYNNIGGNFNVATGYFALYRNTYGTNNIALGNNALYYNTTGSGNTGIGLAALLSSTTSSDNTAVGNYSLSGNTTGFSNVAVGAAALRRSTLQTNLVAVGDSALFNNGAGGTRWQGILNTAIGSKTLYSNTFGSYNTANGWQALYSNTTGFFNTSNGTTSMWNTTTGSSNTSVGYASLYTNTTGSGNLALGHFADVTSGSLTNATAIGFDTKVDASNKVRVGNTNVTSIGGQVGWTTFSDGRYKKNIKENVKGLVFINSLRPVTYTVDTKGLSDHYKNKSKAGEEQVMKTLPEASENTGDQIVYNGFIAQEVEAAARKLGYDFSGVDKPQTSDGLYGIRYGDFVVPLVKAIQELSQKVDVLQKQLDAATAANNAAGVPAQQNNTITREQVYLSQNAPNPFTQTTLISYDIPGRYKTAHLVITDKLGRVVRDTSIPAGEKGSLRVDGGTLTAGTYQYSLFADGKQVASRQMILTK